MKSPDTEPNEIQQRLARAESQLRRMKVMVIALVILVVMLLIPPARAVLGFTLLVCGIVLAVLLFIALVIQALHWASEPGGRSDRAGG